MSTRILHDNIIAYLHKVVMTYSCGGHEHDQDYKV